MSVRGVAGSRFWLAVSSASWSNGCRRSWVTLSNQPQVPMSAANAPVFLQLTFSDCRCDASFSTHAAEYSPEDAYRCQRNADEKGYMCGRASSILRLVRISIRGADRVHKALDLGSVRAGQAVRVRSQVARHFQDAFFLFGRERRFPFEGVFPQGRHARHWTPRTTIQVKFPSRTSASGFDENNLVFTAGCNKVSEPVGGQRDPKGEAGQCGSTGPRAWRQRPSRGGAG